MLYNFSGGLLFMVGASFINYLVVLLGELRYQKQLETIGRFLMSVTKRFAFLCLSFPWIFYEQKQDIKVLCFDNANLVIYSIFNIFGCQATYTYYQYKIVLVPKI